MNEKTKQAILGWKMSKEAEAGILEFLKKFYFDEIEWQSIVDFLSAHVQDWISVEDELPPIGERVFVAYQAKSWSNWMFEVARFGEGYCWNWETVYWKPLPTPPEEEEC